LAAFVLAIVCGVRLLHLDFFERLERITYDLRVRTALHFPAPVATNLAFVSMEDSSITAVKNGSLGYKFGLYWPRQVYGRLVEELSAQGAQTVAFDVLFGELRNDHPPVQMADGSLIESDDFFAQQMRRASNVVIAITPELRPPDLFATNALALGGISTDKDSDGTLRRVEAFHVYRRWHPLLKKAAAEFGLDLDNAQFAPNKIILPQTGTTNVIAIPVDAENNFSLADFIGDKLSPEIAPKAKSFTDERIWHMGIVLAAQELKLDLQNAEIDLPHGKIILHGANGVERVIPVDANGYFYIDWRLTPNDPKLLRAPIESLLWEDKQRLLGETNGLSNAFRGKLVVVGSTAQGNDLTDRGATPLEKDTFLVSKHWNVANSVITGQFIRRASLPVEIALIILLGALTAFLTWRLRAFWGTGGTLLLMLAYIAVAFFAFIEFRYWLPLVFPIVGAMLVEHVSLVTYRVVFEEREQRRVKSVFSKIVSPDVVNELLRAEKLSLGGARCEVTAFFADVRGFTTFTDETQERVSEFVREQQLDLEAAEKCFDESARETLETVNLYLATVADAVKNHGGTLDKYIGDCVMAFWNAPIANEKHALACVRAAIEAQRAIYELNQKRLAQNSSREIENTARLSAGLPPKPPLTALQLGTGINTGLVTVGLMGSDAHILNYTIFGREVNLASRLEGVSGSGRIIISDTTYNHLLRHDPALASTCVEMFPVTVKGIKAAVRIYEVPWQNK
ncbi:MAG TPA: adenylate/guanylate cyclase domain-containing protein, partial [Verrucomicrobiae bacterium]|jgi:class 3 adenylate cyclase|nr:adenylate/guanylate cyclase domain-containing protein [Verrucomicrobiae bacterium]